MHALQRSRRTALLKALYGDRGPDLIEFCDYLAEGFVTVQDASDRAPRGSRDTLVCVRLHTTSELCAVLDGHLPDDFGTVAIHDAERYVLRHADRILWSGGDVLGTYERFYGADALAPGGQAAGRVPRRAGAGAGRRRRAAARRAAAAAVPRAARSGARACRT